MTPDINKLTFVLPLALQGTGRDQGDLERASLLLESLQQQLPATEIEEILIITRDDEASGVQKSLRPYQQALPIHFLSETVLCPGLADNQETLNLWPRPNLGWFRQQLIKFAAHQHVNTPFYMALDADVIFARPFRVHDLISSQHGLLATIHRQDLQELLHDEVAQHEITVREYRVAQAEQVLKLQRPSLCRDYWTSETPVLLNRTIVARMANHLQTIWDQPWQEALLSHLPWTEYNLYIVFAEATGLLSQHHNIGGLDAVLRFSKSLWRQATDYRLPMDLNNWDLTGAFSPTDQGVAVVVQSYLGYCADDVRQRVAGHLTGGR